MRVSSLSLLAFLPALTSVLASDVIDLTTTNFQAEIFDQDLALVEFFAPWCGHCKNLAPHYEEAATTLKSERGIKLAKVDCTAEQEVCSSYGVQGYPTLKIFRNGVPSDYTGPRQSEGIVSYMVKQSLPAITGLTPESHDDFIKTADVVVVAYGDEAHPVPSSFIDFANQARDLFPFGTYVSSPLPEIPSGSSLPIIVLYKSFDEGHVILPADELKLASVEEVGSFIKANSIPLFAEIGPENFGSYAEQGLPIAYLFVDPAAEASRDAIIADLSSLASELRGLINFVWIDAIKFRDHGKALGLSGDSWPAFVIQDLAAQTKYVYTGDITSTPIERFTNDVILGDIAPTIKSESLPETQNDPVYKLTAVGWDQLFDDVSKDVFAEFYAPWCGHCQRLAPIWESLGERYAGNSNIVIAQMDATENDIPSHAPFRVQGFPTLKFRPAGSSEFVDYSGDRSLESLVEFIEEHSRSTESELVEREEEEEDEESEDAEEETHAHDEL